jgi:hypothetical protein
MDSRDCLIVRGQRRTSQGLVRWRETAEVDIDTVHSSGHAAAPYQTAYSSLRLSHVAAAVPFLPSQLAHSITIWIAGILFGRGVPGMTIVPKWLPSGSQTQMPDGPVT